MPNVLDYIADCLVESTVRCFLLWLRCSSRSGIVFLVFVLHVDACIVAGFRRSCEPVVEVDTRLTKRERRTTCTNFALVQYLLLELLCELLHCDFGGPRS